MKYTFEPGDDIPAESFQTIDPDNLGLTLGKLDGGDNFIDFEVDEVLVVAGGGGAGAGGDAGSYYRGGSGAGGGLIYKDDAHKITKKIISVVVGAGGAGAAGGSYASGSNGEDSSFDSLIAKGGGRGGGSNAQGGTGGSGGGTGGANSPNQPIAGGVANQATQEGDSGDFGFGNNGGGYNDGKCGTGGGASGAGVMQSAYNTVASGGAGKTVYGSVYSKGGDIQNTNPGPNGGANTGNGGAAVNNSGSSNTGGNGGSGIVIIKYLTSKASGLTITGGTKTTDGDYTIHTFTSSGDFVIDGTTIGNFVDLGDGDNNGKFTIDIDGIEYEDVSVDLSSVETLDDVASAVQTAIRAETGDVETCVWDGVKFVITSANPGNDSAILKLTAPTTGTDISVEGYLDLGANATEILGNNDSYRLVRLDDDGLLPEELLDITSNTNDFSLLASTNIRTASDDAVVNALTSYVKVKEILFNDIPGTINVTFTFACGAATGKARIYKNGVAYGAENIFSNGANISEALAFATGDLIQLYTLAVTDYPVTASLFRLKYDKVVNTKTNTVNL